MMALLEDVQEDKEILIAGMKLLMERIDNSTGGMNTATKQINGAVTDVKHLRNEIQRMQAITAWIKFGDWFWPLSMFFITLGVGFGGGVWLMSSKYNEDPINSLGRNLVNWNIDRILKCQKDKNPKCTLWRVPPSERPKNKK